MATGTYLGITFDKDIPRGCGVGFCVVLVWCVVFDVLVITALWR